MRLLILACAIALTSCVTEQQITKKYWDQWGSKPIAQAISFYGPPDKTFENPDKSKVYEWTRTGATRGTAQTWGGVTNVGVSTQTCTIRLTADPKGIISYSAWSGNSC